MGAQYHARLLALSGACRTAQSIGGNAVGRRAADAGDRPRYRVLAALNREDRLTLLLVEQRVAEALESCDYGYVLETGRVVLEGRHETLIADDRVRRAYLGM